MASEGGAAHPLAGGAAPAFEDCMRTATQAHKSDRTQEAIQWYRAALGIKPHPQAQILLASALLMTPAGSALEQGLRDAEADTLASQALTHVHDLTHTHERASLYTRYGYYQLTRASKLAGNQAEADDDHDGAHALGTHGGALLAEAITCFRRALELKPMDVLTWKNLSTAYRLAGEKVAAEEAIRKAVTLSPCPAPADLLYRHAKALRKLERFNEACAVFCDIMTHYPRDPMALFWLRVMLADASERAACSTETVQRARAIVERHEADTAGSDSVAIPHEYVRKLFDGYAKKFDEHLTVHLRYATPRALLLLALVEDGGSVSSTSTTAPRQRWNRCADLGCGTGLAGVEFRGYVGYLAGVDLSGGMVAEARERKLYDELAVDEVGRWCAAVASRADAPNTFDCIVCADVLVYIAALDDLFSKVAAIMAAAADTPPIFLCSTEADLEQDGDEAPVPGYTLTGTGRCAHARAYVVAAAARAGLTLRRRERKAIRQNAGVDVIGDLFLFAKQRGA